MQVWAGADFEQGCGSSIHPSAQPPWSALTSHAPLPTFGFGELELTVSVSSMFISSKCVRNVGDVHWGALTLCLLCTLNLEAFIFESSYCHPCGFLREKSNTIPQYTPASHWERCQHAAKHRLPRVRLSRLWTTPPPKLQQLGSCLCHDKRQKNTATCHGPSSRLYSTSFLSCNIAPSMDSAICFGRLSTPPDKIPSTPSPLSSADRPRAASHASL